MTIGQVVDILKNDYPDISISKIRYLEGEGLIKPARTKGGYRNFTEFDVERLRTILALQDGQYLPLQVIKNRLKKNPSIIIKKDPIKKEQSKIADIEVAGNKMYSLSELAKKTGASLGTLEAMIKYGLIKEGSKDGGFTGLDIKIVDLAKGLKRFGIDPRHLRMFVTSSEREATLYRQIFEPALRSRPAKNISRIKEMLEELKQTLGELESILLDREIGDLFEKL